MRLIVWLVAASVLVSACGNDKPAAGSEKAGPSASATTPGAGGGAAAQGAGGGAAGASKGAPGAGGPPAPAVGVVKPLYEQASLVTELPGRLEALRTAQIRARVAGIVHKRTFQEGSEVKAGQTLYQLDPAPLRATLDAVQATARRSEATLMQASANVRRLKPLAEADAVSQQDYTNAQAAEKQAEADVASGRAAVQTARINLGYTTITAPIAGRIGRSLVTEGALVGQGEATQMAIIQQTHPIFVNFTQSVADVLRLRTSLASGKLKAAGNGQSASVRLVLEDGSSYPHAGRLLFSDLSVDQASGQVTLRAEVPNPDGLLLPGMYVRVRVEQAQYEAALLVPQQAVQRGAQGDTVMVVDDKGLVSPRPVKLGSASGARWIITEGLKPGEQVMVDGFQKLQMLPPGSPVKAVPWKAPQQTAAAPAAAASAPASAPAAKP